MDKLLRVLCQKIRERFPEADKNILAESMVFAGSRYDPNRDKYGECSIKVCILYAVGWDGNVHHANVAFSSLNNRLYMLY